jgi:hypothetical protein
MDKVILVLMLSFFLLINCNHKSNTLKDTQEYPADLNIQTREQWGWKPIKQKSETQEINKITIHHGGVEFKKDEDPVQYLRNLQDWSRIEKGWIDIPYHFMIDLDGNIYEARPIQYPGDTNTDYDVRGHALICVMGNYEIQTLSQHQLDQLIKLTAFLAEKYHVPVDSIKGHKDYAETACPGKNLYRYLEDGTIRNRVQEILKNK